MGGMGGVAGSPLAGHGGWAGGEGVRGGGRGAEGAWRVGGLVGKGRGAAVAAGRVLCGVGGRRRQRAVEASARGAVG